MTENSILNKLENTRILRMFLEGYLLGLGMIVFIGPVFFLLLSISLQLGTKAGIFVALGIVISDVVCVYICYYGLAAILFQPDAKFWTTLIGGIILILLGVKYIIKPAPSLHLQNTVQKTKYLICFTKGFLVNFVNPFVFLVWIGVITYLRQVNSMDHSSHIYLAGVLTAILNTDLLKVFLARQIKIYLNEKALIYLFRFCGLSLICFGFRLLFLLV